MLNFFYFVCDGTEINANISLKKDDLTFEEVHFQNDKYYFIINYQKFNNETLKKSEHGSSINIFFRS